MNYLHRLVTVALAAFFIASSAAAQSSGNVTNHAFALGKGAGSTGYTSLLCTSAQLAVGQAAADPICKTITGDVTLDATGATAIGATKVTSAMLNSNVFSTAHSWSGQQTFVAPILGTPASGVATNLTGLPISTGVSGLGTGVAAFLATPSSANLRAALTDEVGTGAAYFVGGALGTPASGTATNLTGLPLSGLTAQNAFTFVGNNTSGSAIPTAVDIAALTAKASPASTDLIILSDQAASGSWKKVTVSSLASAGSVASIAGNTGAFTLSNGLTNVGNDIRLAFNAPVVQSAGGTGLNPTSTTSTTAVMMGMGGTIKITPAMSTRVKITMTGILVNDHAAGQVFVQLRFGTGTAPANGVAVTGMQIGTTKNTLSGVANQGIPYSGSGVVTGLTVGTAYWFDIAINSGNVAGSGAFLQMVDYTIEEI